MWLTLSLCATRLIKIAKMRIAFCSDSVPPVWDGVTRTLSELVTTLTDARVEFQFLSAVHPDPRLAWCDRVHVVPSVPFPLYPYYRLGLPVRRRLDRVLDRFAPDLIHVVTPSLLGLYGLRYARRRGIPVLASFHTDFVGLLEFYWLRYADGLARFLARRFYGQCATTLVPSRHQAAKLSEYGIQNVGLWRRGVDSTAFSPAFRSAGLRTEIGADGVPIVLYVGRLGREKNLNYLIAAIELLRRGGTAFKLVIVGQGPMRRKRASRGTSRVRSSPAGMRVPMSSCSRRPPRRSGTWCSRHSPRGSLLLPSEAGRWVSSSPPTRTACSPRLTNPPSSPSRFACCWSAPPIAPVSRPGHSSR